MTMDTGEFYKKNELEKAKRTITSEGISHAYCGIVNYGFQPDEVVIDDDGHVEFFSKLTIGSCLKKNKHVIAIVDPTRILSHYCNAKYFFLHDIKMHHMSSIRKNLDEKYYNSSNGINCRKMNIAARHDFIRQNSVKYRDLFNLKILVDTFPKNDKME